MSIITGIDPTAPATVLLPQSTIESLGAVVSGPESPDTGIAPRWIATASSTPPDDADTWVAGSWSGLWDGTEILALSPTLADEDAEYPLAAGTYNVYLKFVSTSGDETPIRHTHRLTLK